MKIFDRPGFPNPARIRIVLAEKGLESEVEFVSVDLIAADRDHRLHELLGDRRKRHRNPELLRGLEPKLEILQKQ